MRNIPAISRKHRFCTAIRVKIPDVDAEFLIEAPRVQGE